MKVNHADTWRRTKPFAGRFWFVPGCIFIGSCLLYLINLGRAPHPDELYHVLAARGLLDSGEPRIAEGLYARVYLYTWLVARTFAIFGESLSVARLPSLVAIAALNTLMLVWLRREAGTRAAVLAAFLFAASPFALDIAQFVRFYAMQALVFFTGCLAVYEMVRRPLTLDRWRIVLGVGAAACFALAVHLQPTTLLGLIGLGLWLLTAIGIPWLTNPTVARRHKQLAIAAGLATALALALLMLTTGLATTAWHQYRWVPIFNTPYVDQFWYYHVYNIVLYPSLWPVIGLLSFAALATWPRVAWLAVVVFAVGFLLNSFAGPKSLRYIFYAQPFLFILFGLGLAAVLPWLSRAVSTFKRQLETHLAGIGLAGWRLPTIVFWGGLVAILLGNGALPRTVTLLADITVPPQMPTIRWQAALPSLEPLLDEVEVVVTMAELETLYFWDRYDVLFSPSRLSEMPGRSEFDTDFRTGRPVISTMESLARLMSCTDSGIFVAPLDRWPMPQFIDRETMDFIISEMASLELPPTTNLLVFGWRQALRAVPETCEPITAAIAGLRS